MGIDDEPTPEEEQPSEAAQTSESRAEKPNDEHDSLKYHLLGPSLTKSGQDGVDQTKVSEVIYNASKGSKYFNNEEVKDKNLTQKIERILARKRQLDKLDMTSYVRRADEQITELELSRDLSQTVVHVDCDAFYAAVEEIDRPELKDVPFAVGKGVLTTCNYHARKFGCRSAMAGFVAMKLCPQLICLPLNFDKYIAKANEVRAILAQYDPNYQSASLDEAYLNITSYCSEHDRDAWEVVEEMRQRIHEDTRITVSAGLGANATIAKICSNKNKPNGQFRVPNDRVAIMDFMRGLPTRKVNGIGRVFERELSAIGVSTCGHLYEFRGYLSSLFGDKAFQFLVRVYLGLGRTKIQPAEDYERKSVGTESTFGDMSDPEELKKKLRHTAEELEGDLTRTGFKGRTLCLKIKLHTYEVLSRQAAPPGAINKADDLYKYSLPMLVKLQKEIPGMRLRLMGLRVTHLVSTKKTGIDFFGLGRTSTAATTGNHEKIRLDDDGEWEKWPEAEFEEAARQEKQDDMNEVLALSQEHEESNEGEKAADKSEEAPQSAQYWACPICATPQEASDATFNAHIDFCLSRQTIRDAAKDATPEQQPDGTAASNKVVKGKKRGRPSNQIEQVGRPRKAFFS